MYTFTKEGIEIQKALLKKRETEYLDICNERKLAHDLSGDGWHDNPHFNRLQQLEACKNHEIKELQNIIKTANVIDFNVSPRPTSHVGVGSFVTIELHYINKCIDEIQNWEIVGYGETNIKYQKLAYNTPIASAIIGLEIGDEVECSLPHGTATIFVENIENKITKTL